MTRMLTVKQRGGDPAHIMVSRIIWIEEVASYSGRHTKIHCDHGQVVYTDEYASDILAKLEEPQ